MENKEELFLIKQFLDNMGYDERSIKSIEKDGGLIKLVNEQLQWGEHEVSADGRLYFSVPLEGNYDFRRDRININFEFSCLPNKSQLKLEGINASLNLKESQLQYRSQDIPPLKDLYENLVLAKTHSVAHQIMNHKTQLTQQKVHH